MSEERFKGLAESGPRNVLAILAVLNARAATGVLRFEPSPDPEYVVEFLFREGKLLFTTTNRPGARLGEFLVRHNVLSGPQATSALLEAKRRGRLFHGYLADDRLVERKVLQDLLYERTEELLYSVLQVKDGRFVFEESQLRQFDRQVPTVDEALFAQLLTFRNLWAPAYEKLGTARLILRRVPRLEATLHDDTLSGVERQTLELVDGWQPVHRLLEGRRDRVEMTIRLAQLLESGLIQVAKRDSQPAAPSLSMEAAEPAASRPHEAAEPRTAAAPAEPRERQASNAASIDLEMLPALTPGTDLNKITATGLTMDDLFVLSQIDGRTSLRELISITRMDEKRLFRLMHHLVGIGCAELKPRPVPGPPVRSIRTPSRVTATRSSPQEADPAGPGATSEPRKPFVSEGQPAPWKSPEFGAASEPMKPVVPQATPATGGPPAPSAPADPKVEALRLHARAVAAYNAQNFPAAENLLLRGLSLDRRSPRIRAHLALAVAERANQIIEAQRIAQEAFEEDPLESQCLEAMGFLKLKLGDYIKAKLLFERAVLLDRSRVPSSAAILDELKRHQPAQGHKPEELWAKIRGHIRLTS